MPVPRGCLETELVLSIEMPTHHPNKYHQQNQCANGYVGSVEAGQHEEGRAIHARAQRQPQFLVSVDVFLRLKDQKRYAQQHGQPQPHLQRTAMAFVQCVVSNSHGHAGTDQQYGVEQRQTPHILLTRYKNPHSTSAQIRRYLMQDPPIQWLELSEIAHHFNMSEATIQRRLKSEGFSYQQLKNDIRRDMAIELLSNSQVSLQDISTELNFHDPSAFHRAFKKWTGVSPGAYRQNKDA